jgi:hypothetical protein
MQGRAVPQNLSLRTLVHGFSKAPELVRARNVRPMMNNIIPDDLGNP